VSSVPAFVPCDGYLPADGIDASYGYCRELVRSCSTSFYHSMRLIREPRRSATYALYSWMRLADDLADGHGGEDEKTELLHRFWSETQSVLRSPAHAARHHVDADHTGAAPLWPAFRDSCTRYGLPQSLLRDFISGQLLDLRKTQYATFEELYDYCYKVASVVGLLCIEVWGYSGGEETRRLAEWRGVAFQLTNIARDVREDALQGRVYLPAAVSGGRQLSPAEILRGNGWAAALDAVESVCRLARAYYDASAPLDERVDPSGRACLRAMTRTYRGLLDKISCDPGAVLREGRVRLGRVQKVWIALRAACG
jgi:phytoene synthase